MPNALKGNRTLKYWTMKKHLESKNIFKKSKSNYKQTGLIKLTVKKRRVRLKRKHCKRPRKKDHKFEVPRSIWRKIKDTWMYSCLREIRS